MKPTVLVEGGFFRGPWSLCFSRDIFMFVPLLTERRSDGLCLLDHQPSTSDRCCRKLLSMNSAVPKLRSIVRVFGTHCTCRRRLFLRALVFVGAGGRG